MRTHHEYDPKTGQFRAAAEFDTPEIIQWVVAAFMIGAYVLVSFTKADRSPREEK